MAIVSPSILSADFGKLGADCRTVLDAGAQMLHYDVMDGHFVPNISFGVPVLKSLHKALPDAFYDVHLMITHPQQYAEAFAKAGASLVDAGKMEQLLALLAKYGVQAVTQLQPDQYGVFATELRTLGAQL